MLIESNEIHRYLDDLEHQWEDAPSIVILLCRMRAYINNIESAQAAKNAQHKYAEALQGLHGR